MQNELNLTSPRQPRRRPRTSTSKFQPRARLVQIKGTGSFSNRQKAGIALESGFVGARQAEEATPAKAQNWKLSPHITICNAVLGVVGFVSAISFGVITIVQSNTANREAKIANDIAYESLLLSWVQTCAQVVDVGNSTMCALVRSFVEEAFWPGNVGFNFWRSSSKGAIGRRLWTYDSHYHFSSINLTVPSLRVDSACLSVSGYNSWRYKLFGQSYLSPQDLAINIDLTRSYNVGWQFERRLVAFTTLICLLWFLASGLVLRIDRGWDFVSVMMEKRRMGRWTFWGVVNCCLLELYYLAWVDLMIRVMLQDLCV